MTAPHCLVIGVGPGTGLACASQFAAEGYSVSMIARHEGRLSAMAAEVGGHPYPADIAQLDTYRATLEQIVRDHGPPRVVVYNATLATFGTMTEIDTDRFELSYRVNTTGLLVTAQALTPAMLSFEDSAFIITGNTGSLRGKPGFVGWSPSKAGQRILAECLARELGPQGIHVAYVVIDAIIDMPFARRADQAGMKERSDEEFAKPAELAQEIYHIAHQPRSARSFLVELRPFGERW